MTEPTDHADHAIKVRKEGERVYRFLTPKGGETRLRLHAATITKANGEAMIVQLAADNPGFEFKVVPLFAERDA
jgi:hypothetical protein